MHQTSRTLSAPHSSATSFALISNSKRSAAGANKHQHCRMQSGLSAVTCQFFNINCNSFSMPSYLILLLFCLGAQRNAALVHAQDSTTAAGAADAAPSPHAAALASPGTGGGSSILDQFSPNCTAVSHIFQARGIDQAEIPQKPSNEMVLRYCESPSVGTCCTYNMETRMALQSRIQLERQSKDQITKMSNALAAKAQKFNSIFRKLLSESKEEFHNMFTRTYGVIYQQNSYVFSDLFNELENYYTRGRTDLLDVMDKFFNTLYQKMFQVLNGQYTFDEKFLHCVSEHMKELKPFGDVPDKLALQIKRSFVATRTYWQALHTAAEVSKKLINVHLNADCTAALTKMQHCGACKGYAQKPCTNYCVNVIKGCLHYVNEFDSEWENFAVAMDKVAERLLGSFNIVMVVEPINIKISEAIMNFQESGQAITSRVFEGCGRPTLGRTRRSMNPKFTQRTSAPVARQRLSSVSLSSSDSKVIRKRATLEVPTEQIESDILDIDADVDDAIVLRERRASEPGSEEQSAEGDKSNGSSNGGGSGGRRNQQRRKPQQNRKNDDDYNGRDPNLDKLVREIRQRVKESKKFWSNLPHQICSNDETSTSSDVDGMCWNGHTIDRYMHPVTTEQTRNPEFPGNPASTRQISQVATQLFYLKNVINHLRNAYNGQDVEWSDHDAIDGSGAGSGAGSDDEDDDEGSGLSGGPFTPPHLKPTDRPSVPANNIDDEDGDDVEERRITDTSHTTRPKYPGSTSGGAAAGGDTNSIEEEEENDDDDDNDLDADKDSGNAGAKTAPKMTLRRALLMYLLPLYMAWFGGCVADML
ncbi:glypican-6 isoform X2 [Rhagoletis pomonella]|uniref:glypican-6 isoform X2 n=1 Tax=Rhagoletis pomonella TaxID=28610 RepID=UPI001783F9BD|nr:glypican-6 isoform X2 [Rhagoletis pomonella]